MERHKAYLDGFATGRLVLQHDAMTVEEILDSLDPRPEEDWAIHPWKKGYRAAMRSAFGR